MQVRPDPALEQQVLALLGDYAPWYAVVAVDMKTGRSVAVNAERTFYAASVFKIWVMYEVFHQQSLGLFSLSDQLVITPYYDAFGLGPRSTELCGTYTILELLEAMMSISDNAAAVLLQDLVGAPNINSSLEALGLTESRLTIEQDLPVNARDTALLLEIIAAGKAVSPEASQTMASLMMTEQFDNGIKAGLPAGATLAHKTGNWSNARHDAGIVFTGDSVIVLVILSEGGAYDVIRDLSAAVVGALAQ